MSKKSVVLLIGVVLLASVLTAGCSSNVQTLSPSPSVSPSAAATPPVTVNHVTPTALPSSAAEASTSLGSYLGDQGYTVVTPFSKHVASNGNVQYNGTISDGKYNYATIVEMTGTAQATATRYAEIISRAHDLGYATYDEGSTYWMGYNSQTGITVYFTEDTANGAIWGFSQE
jgi:hypothetical protein